MLLHQIKRSSGWTYGGAKGAASTISSCSKIGSSWSSWNSSLLFTFDVLLFDRSRDRQSSHHEVCVFAPRKLMVLVGVDGDDCSSFADFRVLEIGNFDLPQCLSWSGLDSRKKGENFLIDFFFLFKILPCFFFFQDSSKKCCFVFLRSLPLQVFVQSSFCVNNFSQLFYNWLLQLQSTADLLDWLPNDKKEKVCNCSISIHLR